MINISAVIDEAMEAERYMLTEWCDLSLVVEETYFAAPRVRQLLNL
jgi:hypothetical protein